MEDDIINPATLPEPNERYEIEKRLGGGVFGDVFLAKDNESQGRSVAVKVQRITVESEPSILDEYRILKDFCTSNANLVNFYGIYCDRSEPSMKIWFVMEYCGGGPVIDMVRGLQAMDKKIKEEHIAYILKETIKALTYLHENNVIHRDVRASNILLSKEGEVKLADFGLSCRLQTNLGKRTTVIGSPSWMAPEVVAGGDSSYGNRADVWSLGITAIELGDGKAPFQEMHPTRALFQIVRNPPPTLHKTSNWSNELNDFIAECLEKNPEHRPYSMELIEHPFIALVPENDYHLSQELKMLLGDVGDAGKERRLPERLIKNGMLQTESNREPEAMHVEDLAALEKLNEDSVFDELQDKMANGMFQTFIGDVFLYLNPNCDSDIYNQATHEKYKFKSRSDNEPHIYAVADSAYQDALHHDEPQFIVFTGESCSGKTTIMMHAMKHLTYLGELKEATGGRLEKAMGIIQAIITAGTPINSNSTRCILQTQMTYGKSGKLSGAIFWIFQLEKWRVSSTDLTHSNFNIMYYFYDGMAAAGKLEEYFLEPDRNHRYLRIPDSPPKVQSSREDPEGNVDKFKELEQQLKDLEFEAVEIDALWKTLAAILVLGNVRFKDGSDGAAEVENPKETTKVATLLSLDESKFSWALINYCLVEKGTAVKRRHSTDEARDARDVLAGTIYRRLVDWLINTINMKLSFSRSVFGDKYSISLLDMFGFECFHRNRLEQLIINTMNEQMQFLYNQRLFAWEMQEQEEEQVPVATLHFYDNKTAVDQLMSKPLGLFYILDEACRSNGGQDFIMSTIKNSSKGPYIKLAGAHEFSVAHYTGKINYDARDLAEKNRDFLPPEMIETLRASSNTTVRHFFTNKLTKSGSLTAPSFLKTSNDTLDKEAESQKPRKYNTESKGQYSQLHRMRTVAGTYRATSLELLRTLASAPGAAGVMFVRCIRPSLTSEPMAFQPDVVKQQMRAMSVVDTAKAKQLGFSTRIPFAEFLRRYKFLAFDFDENVDITKDNCRLLLIRLKMEGWVIGKTKVFLKYYNVEYLSRLYETQVKKIIKVQSMMRAFLTRRRMEKKNNVSRPRPKQASVEQPQPQPQPQQQQQQQEEEQPASDMSEEHAAVMIQKAYRGFAVRKAYGPLVSRSTGKIDEETADFLRRYAAKWRSKTVFQVLLQYRAARYQDLVNFSQQVHMFNQATMQSLVKSNTGVSLGRVDPHAKRLEFLGPPQQTVWKLPFNINELPYFDTTYMCDFSARCNDNLAPAYDSESETWDEPLRRRTRAASHQIYSSIQKSYEEYPLRPECSPKKTQPNLIHVPYCRDPSKKIAKLAPEPSPKKQHKEPPRPVVYKKKASPSKQRQFVPPPTYEAPTPRTCVYNSNYNNNEDWRSRKPSPVKVDVNRNMSNPIKELQQLARANSSDFPAEDEPPFNFQAMLRKTPRNRESMKRVGESSPLLAKFEETKKEPNLTFTKVEGVKQEPNPIQRKHSKGRAPPRPNKTKPTSFTRKDSVELFKMAVKRADSSQNFFNKTVSNGNVGEIVQLAPGIIVEGYVMDL